MPDLDEPQKRAVIMRLARFATAKEVRAEIKQAYGLDLSAQQINAYNPTTLAGQRLSDEHKQLFEETRKAALDDEDAIPGSKRSYRLLRYMQIVESADSAVIQLKALEIMAKEMGGLYSRPEKDKPEGDDPSAIAPSLQTAVDKIYGEPDPDSGGDGGSGAGSDAGRSLAEPAPTA